MARRADCPSWCAEHLTYPTDVQHRFVVGDVRLTRVNAVGARRTICAVRRRPGRTPAQAARLCEDLATASALLRREHRRRVAFEGNSAFPGNHAFQDDHAASLPAEPALR